MGPALEKKQNTPGIRWSSMQKGPTTVGCAGLSLSLYSGDTRSLSCDRMMSRLSSCPWIDRDQSSLQTQARSGRHVGGGQETSKPPTAGLPVCPPPSPSLVRRPMPATESAQKEPAGSPPRQQPGPGRGTPWRQPHSPPGHSPSHQEKLSCQQERHHPNSPPTITNAL